LSDNHISQDDIADAVRPLIISPSHNNSLSDTKKTKRENYSRTRALSDSIEVGMSQTDFLCLTPTPRKKPSVTSDQRRHKGNPSKLRSLRKISRSLDSLLSERKDVSQVWKLT